MREYIQTIKERYFKALAGIGDEDISAQKLELMRRTLEAYGELVEAPEKGATVLPDMDEYPDFEVPPDRLN